MFILICISILSIAYFFNLKKKYFSENFPEIILSWEKQSLEQRGKRREKYLVVMKTISIIRVVADVKQKMGNNSL
jgi:hypothetical protein